MLNYFKNRWAVFKFQPYRWFVLSCLLAMAGNGLSYIVTAWLVLGPSDAAGQGAHQGLTSVMILMLCTWVPVLLLSPIAGVIADRYNRRWVIFCSNAARAVIIVVVVYLFSKHLTVTTIYLLGLSLSVFAALYSPAAMAIVRETVPKKLLLSGNATVDMAYEGGNLLGMGLAGLIIAAVTAIGALYINGLLFAVSAITILLMNKHQFVNKSEKNEKTQGFYADFISGLKYLLKRKQLLVLYTIQLLIVCVWMTAPIIMAPFAKILLHATVRQFGYIEASMSIGLLVGGVFTPWLAEKFGFYSTLIVQMIVMVIAFTWFAFVHSISMAEVLYLVIGFCFSAWPVMLTKAQDNTALSFQGRVQSTFMSLSGVIVFLTYLSMALIGDHISLRHVFWFEVFFAVASIALLIYCRRLETADGSGARS